MKKIYKYQLEIGSNVLSVPVGMFKPLCVQMQNGCMTLWAEVADDRISTVTIQVFGTGWEIPDDLRYIGTVQYSDGTVWHAYW